MAFKYPKVADLQRGSTVQLTANPDRNPHEVFSDSGHEDSFARPEDAEAYADELRRAGVRGVQVKSRARKTGKKNPDEEQFDTDILAGIERALWVTSWAEYVKSLSKADRKAEGLPVNLSGLDWDEVAPQSPASALLAAQDLYLLVERANGKTPGDLFQEACRVDGCPWSAENAELFGHYLAMQSLGEGVSWFDDHKQFKLKFPDRGFEAHYDSGEVWWSPQVRSRENPAPSIDIGTIMARAESPGELYRVTRKIGGRSGGFQLQPYRRAGKEVMITRDGNGWTDGSSQWLVANAAPGWNLGDPMILGTYAAGSRVQLAHHNTRTNTEEPGDWVVIIRNNAKTAGTMTLKNERNGSTHEKDGRTRLYALDRTRLTKER